MVASAKHATPDELVGRVIEDRYEVLCKLGDSQLGRVYEAKHVTLGRPVTLEVLGPALACSQAAQACFLRQARQASRLRHRGIVEVEHQGITPNDSVYMASEPVQGTTLDVVLRRETKLPWARARGIALQIAEALKAAHRRSVVHGGLHSMALHLWIERDGHEWVKVSGFGMAEVAAQAQRQPDVESATTRSFGDGRYMSPEQVVGGRGSVKSDVYALGAVLYHLLTGEPPVRRESTSREIVPARRKEPAIPEAVEASLVRALSLKAAGRHESVQELELELEAVAADEVGRGEVVAAVRQERPGEQRAGVESDAPSSPGAGPSPAFEAFASFGPPMLVSSERMAMVEQEEATTLLERAPTDGYVEPTMMFDRVPAGVSPAEPTTLLTTGHLPKTKHSAHGEAEDRAGTGAARPLPLAAQASVLAAAWPAPPIVGSLAPEPIPPVARAPVANRTPLEPPTMSNSTSWSAPARAREPTIGRPLPDVPPPDRTWLLAILSAVLVAMGGMGVGIMLAQASEPERGGREAKPSGAPAIGRQ